MLPQLKTYHKLLLILFLSGSAISAKAQLSDSATYLPHHTYYWIGGHVGGGTYPINLGTDAGVLLFNKLVIATKIDVHADVTFFGHPEHIQANEYAMLAGWKLTHMRYSYLTLLSGISAVRIEDRGDIIGHYDGWFGGNDYGDNKVYTGVGVPLIMRFSIVPAPPVALDFALSANVNGKRSFVALSFGVTLGKLRSGLRADPPAGAGLRSQFR